MYSFKGGKLVLVDGVVHDWGLAWNEVVGGGLVLMRLFVVFFVRIRRVGLLYAGWRYSVVVVIVVLRAHAFRLVADDIT